MPNNPSKTIFLQSLSDTISPDKTISKESAVRLFNFFRSNKLFKWTATHNDCEDRANAVCMVLDAWGVPNYKGWIFSGYFLKKNLSSLINFWNYHVAVLLPVLENNEVNVFILDPTTQQELVLLEDWADSITDSANSYHLVKDSRYYIFDSKKVESNNWHLRDKRNYRWTMQGLSGINGMSSVGKAQLSFNKQKVKKAEAAFNTLKKQEVPF